MTWWLILIIVIYALLFIIFTCWDIDCWDRDGEVWLTYKDWYENTRLNKYGAFNMFLMHLICSPLMSAIWLVYLSWTIGGDK